MLKSYMECDYKNIYHIPGEKPVFCYRFGSVVYEEVMDGGMLVSAGWNAAGVPQNVLEGIPARLEYSAFPLPQAFSLEVDGRSLDWDWQYEGFETREETEAHNGASLLHGIVKLRSALLPLSCEVHTVLDGTGMFTRYITIQNHGTSPMNISALSPMAGGMEIVREWDEYLEGEDDIEKLYDLGYFQDTPWAHEGSFRWHPLPDVGYSVCGRFQRDRYRHPMFLLRNNALGTMFFGQLGWTGGYEMRFDLDRQDHSVGNNQSERLALLSFRIALDSQKPLLVLRPGEVFSSPEVYMGCVQGDLDDAVNIMHDHIRRSVMVLPDARGVRGWVEGGMGPERIMDMDAIRHFADTIAAVGGETFILDAGWYCPAGDEVTKWWPLVGDWKPDEAKYGTDFAEARNYIHSKGLLFGLWMDAERIGTGSEIYKAHPEWASHCFSDGKETTLIDMANPDAAAWVESEIGRLVEEYKIDLFRLDYNTVSQDTFLVSRQDGIKSCGIVRYYEAVYAMYRRLREKYPDVIFENCAGGGGRTDLGMVRNFTHTWVSDWAIAPRSYAITNGMTMALPPEYVDRMTGGMSSPSVGGLDFLVRHALFGRPTTNTYNPSGSELHPGEIAFVRHSFDIYKTFIRPYMAKDGRIYHHTPECFGLRPKGMGILERASRDGLRSVIGVFALANSPERAVTVYPRGIDAGQNYKVTLDNRGEVLHLSGYRLTTDGLRVRLPGSISSELILLEAE